MEKIAIIGGGWSGLTSALLLSEKNEVHLFESSANLGGRASQNAYIFYSNGNRDGIKIDLQNVSCKGYNIDKSLEAYNAKSAKKTSKTETIFKVVV